MTSVYNGMGLIPKQSYITTQAPNTHIYRYTKTYSSGTYTWSGSLTAIDFTQAPYSTYNVAGVVLRENGKKLYAGANPGIDRYMVGVFILNPNVDVGELGPMYIDPNCSVFAAFNGEKPPYIPTATDDHASPSSDDLGNPVYTLGNITTTQGNIAASAGTVTAYGNITSTNGNIAASIGSVTAATSVNGATLNATQNLTFQSGRIVGQADMGSGSIVGVFRRLTVNTAAVTTNSRIFLTNASQNNAGTVYSVESISNGVSFQIVSNNTSDGSIINWLVIN
jgi:hypothetical protein